MDPIFYMGDRVVWRNYEASYDVDMLEQKSRAQATDALREYFVPIARFDEFVHRMSAVFRDHDVNIINVSIRHALPDPGTLLAWAEEEVFAFVIYYRQGTDQAAKDRVKAWSLAMIDAALASGGTYYLPYQVFALTRTVPGGLSPPPRIFRTQAQTRSEQPLQKQALAAALS